MGLDDYRVDTFASDYDDTFVDESGYDFDAHEASLLAPLRAAPLRGHFVICNL
jgi:hypothetical protein